MGAADWLGAAAAPAGFLAVLLLLRRWRPSAARERTLRVAALAGLAVLAATLVAAPLFSFAAVAVGTQGGRAGQILSAGLPPLALATVFGAAWMARRWLRRRD